MGPKKFLSFRKVPGFDSPECPCRRGIQSAKHVLTECPTHTRRRNRTWEEGIWKAAFGRTSWEETLTQPKFAKKAAQFIKSLGLTNKFSPSHLTNNPNGSGSKHHRLDSAENGVPFWCRVCVFSNCCLITR